MSSLAIPIPQLHNGDMNELERFGVLLKSAMDAQNISGVELANRLGWTTSMVSNYVKGHRSYVPPEVMRDLSRELGIPRRKMLEVLGYLDPEELEPGVAYVIREDDPRVLLLDAVEGEPPANIESITGAARLFVDAFRRERGLALSRGSASENDMLGSGKLKDSSSA